MFTIGRVSTKKRVSKIEKAIRWNWCFLGKRDKFKNNDKFVVIYICAQTANKIKTFSSSLTWFSVLRKKTLETFLIRHMQGTRFREMEKNLFCVFVKQIFSGKSPLDHNPFGIKELYTLEIPFLQFRLQLLNPCNYPLHVSSHSNIFKKKKTISGEKFLEADPKVVIFYA